MNPTKQGSDVVTFTPTDASDSTPPLPIAANQLKPDWLTNLDANADGIHSFKNSSVKLCMPFNDAVSLGWIIRSPVTAHFERDRGTGELQVDVDEGSVDGDAVTALADVDSEQSGNSSFATPDCLIDLGWEIDTPERTSLLFAPPMNRVEIRFTPASLLVETDSYEGSVNLPLVLTGDSMTIERGDALAQVIPISRNNRLDSPELRSYAPDSNQAELKNRISELSASRSGFYRRDMWVKKPGFSVHTDVEKLPTDSESGGTDRSDKEAGEQEQPRAFLGPGTDQVFYCEESFAGEIPEPKSSEEYIPDQHFEKMQANTDIDAVQPTTEWMRDAMGLGTISPLGIDMHMSRNDDGRLQASGIDEGRFKQVDARKVGDDHPFAPLRPVNMIGHWAPILKHGYSNLYIPPLNHFQQYHQSFAGIVESDRYFSTINIPGVVSPRISDVTLNKGMAVSQAIPLHRKSLVSTAYINND